MPVRVLVVDDNATARASIRQLLEKHGFEIAGEATTGRQAIEQYFKLNPDLVTMDLRMPEMDGVSAIKQIRQRSPDAKIIAVTSVDDDGIAKLATKAGAANYLVKPVNPKQFVEIVGQIVAISQPAPSEHAGNQEFLKLFVEDAKDHCQRLIDSAIKLDTRPADQQAIETVYRSGHTLKGMAGIMGFHDLADLASTLGRLGKLRLDSGQPFANGDLQNLVQAIDAIRTTVGAVESGGVAAVPSPELARVIEESLASAPPAKSRRMKGKSVLVVDDDSVTRQALRTVLSREGFEALTAPDGESGYRLAQSRRPNLIVLDRMMPRLDGIEVCRRLRSDPATKNLRIMMLTSMDDLEDKLAGFDVGADDYVTKPFDPEEVLSRAKALVSRRGRQRAG